MSINIVDGAAEVENFDSQNSQLYDNAVDLITYRPLPEIYKRQFHIFLAIYAHGGFNKPLSTVEITDDKAIIKHIDLINEVDIPSTLVVRGIDKTPIGAVAATNESSDMVSIKNLYRTVHDFARTPEENLPSEKDRKNNPSRIYSAEPYRLPFNSDDYSFRCVSDSNKMYDKYYSINPMDQPPKGILLIKTFSIALPFFTMDDIQIIQKVIEGNVNFCPKVCIINNLEDKIIATYQCSEDKPIDFLTCPYLMYYLFLMEDRIAKDDLETGFKNFIKIYCRMSPSFIAYYDYLKLFINKNSKGFLNPEIANYVKTRLPTTISNLLFEKNKLYSNTDHPSYTTIRDIRKLYLYMYISNSPIGTNNIVFTIDESCAAIPPPTELLSEDLKSLEIIEFLHAYYRELNEHLKLNNRLGKKRKNGGTRKKRGTRKQKGNKKKRYSKKKHLKKRIGSKNK